MKPEGDNNMKNLLNPTFGELEASVIDITNAECVDIQISYKGDIIWVNVNGVCVLRICRIGHFHLDDFRKRGEI
jgi:hypothetical protein